MARILYVEDSSATRSIVVRYLEDAGHEVHSFESCADFIDAARTGSFDAAVVDLSLPDAQGQEVLQQLRAISSAPTLVLTGDATEPSFYAGLSLGADAYLVKPASPRVVVAQVHALLRKPESCAQPLSFGSLRWSPADASWVAGATSLSLTPQESQLLQHLVKLQGALVSREELLCELWGYPSGSSSRAVDEALRRLRIKLDCAGSSVGIETLWGRGVRLVVREGSS